MENDDDFTEISFLNITKENIKTAEKINKIDDCVTPLNPDEREKNVFIQSPEILNETIDFRNDCTSSKKKHLDSDKKLQLSSQLIKSDVKESIFACQEKSMNFPQNFEQINKSLESKSNCQLDIKNEDNQSKVLNSLNVNVLNNMEIKFENSDYKKNIKPKLHEKSEQKIMWNLKKSRELNLNRKLKQTVLSTVVHEKKLDISSLEEYNGGAAPNSQIKKSATKNIIVTDCKENGTFLKPLAASTENYYQTENPSKIIVEKVDNEIKIPERELVSPQKKSSFDIIEKQKTPVKKAFPQDMDTFDFSPSNSPNYMYKRDAVYKKSERLKLPGQECVKCLNFYQMKKSEMSESQIKLLLNKCSRHRDKYPIILNTPPGFWNPVFDDTDNETKL